MPVPVDGDPRRLVLLDRLRNCRRAPWREWAWALGGAALLIAGIVGLTRPGPLTPHWPHVEGVVVQVDERYGHSGVQEPIGHRGTVEYQVDGRTYRYTTARSVDPPLVRGGRVPVYYAPDDPAHAELNPPSSGRAVLSEAALFAGLGGGGYGAWRLAREMRRRRLWDRVALAGVAVTATVTERAPLAQSWLLTAEAEDGRRRRRFRGVFGSELGPGPEVGQAVTVYVDPDAPENYLFGGLAG